MQSGPQVRTMSCGGTGGEAEKVSRRESVFIWLHLWFNRIVPA